MKWALNSRTIRPLIPVCLLALLLIFISSNSSFAQTPGSFIRIKDVPKIIPDPEIQFAEPGQTPFSFDCGASAPPYDPSRIDDKDEIMIEYFESPINYYYWLLNRFPLLRQSVFGH